MRAAARVLAIAVALPCVARLSGAQSTPRKLTAPPDYQAGGARRVPGEPAAPGDEEKSLLERATKMHNLASGLREKADDLRDDNHYEEAEELDERADEYESQATSFERRAERERVGAKGPFRPAE